MGPRRRKDPITSRRRVDDEGEDEEVPFEDDDSISMGTSPSDAEHEADVDEDGSEAEDSPTSRKKNSKRANGNENGNARIGKASEQTLPAAEADLSTVSADTIAMMNGLNVKDLADDGQALQFGEVPQDSSAAPGDDKVETLAEKRRREHEEYKKKRDADPAFVPNRGGFFMHDSRNVFSGPNGFRPSRGRGRGGRGGLPFNPHTSSVVSDAPWAHDLHETVTNTDLSNSSTNEEAITGSQASFLPSRPLVPQLSQTPPNRTFSRTVQVGNVHLRVLLPLMKEPITFSAVPVHSHTRLPHHRPPLRRDKPVRVSLPDHPPRYIFPATDRSFIFIPRAMRPNQQGFGRSRGRGSISGYGNFSARNSMFGGSIYNPSIGTSRRSSMVRDIGREGMASPAGSVVSRNRSIIADPTKPVVRLPPAMDPAMFGQYPMPPMHFTTSRSPVVNLPQMPPMHLPQRPVTQSYPGQIPMHQPRPQKQITVADIESPAALNFPPPQVQQQQPFHHQVPASLNGQAYDPVGSSHSRRTSHPSQQGTPLSQIPERAIHAQSFQPTYQYPPPQGYYPPQFATPVYYYAAGQPMASTVAAPPFIPGQQYPYMLPGTPVAQPEIPPQPGTVAHESNGMVYYYDSSQLPSTGPEEPAIYQQIAYVPPTGYVMAPQGAVFYPPQ